MNPTAWIGVSAVDGLPVLALDKEPRSEACEPWEPLYSESEIQRGLQEAVIAYD